MISDKEIAESIPSGYACGCVTVGGHHLNTHISPALGFMSHLTLGQVSSSLIKAGISSCNFSNNGPVLVAAGRAVVLNNTDGGTSDSVLFYNKKMVVIFMLAIMKPPVLSLLLGNRKSWET